MEANTETDLKAQLNEKIDYLKFLIKIIDKNITKLENVKNKILLPVVIDIKNENISRDILHYFRDLGIIYFNLEEFEKEECDEKEKCFIF